MIVGDSTAGTVGYGLERWGTSGRRALVWSAATEGCGIANDGEVHDDVGRASPVPSQCVSLDDGWADAIEQFQPDMVLVLSQIFDLQDRRLDGWPGFLEPGDPEFDSYLLETYVDAFDALSAGGATVVWFDSPCVNYNLGSFGGKSSALDLEGITHVNDVVLERLQEARPALQRFDLFDVLCPDGEFVEGMDGVTTLRTDGVHFSPEGSLWFAENYGQEILDLAP